MTLRRRRLLAPFARLISPGYACCQHCGMPWKFATPYVVRETVFFACVDCWPLLTPVEAVNYAATVVHGAGDGWRRNQAWDFRRADDALVAVVAELRERAA